MIDWNEETRTEFRRMAEDGMEPMSPRDLDEHLHALGYRRNEGESFCYVNTLNSPRRWKAKSIFIEDTRSGLGFANEWADKSRLRELQALRFRAAVMHRERIWEL